MSRVENLINMMHEFDYKKNGREKTIMFLEIMIEYFEETSYEEWEEKNESINS